VFELPLTVYEFLRRYCHLLVADIDDAQFACQPSPGLNPPAWLLGHLALVPDFLAHILGTSPHMDPAWLRQFGPGSVPSNDRAAYPSKVELLAAYEAAHDRMIAAVRQADPVALRVSHGVDLEILKVGLPTKADVVSHLLTSHEAAHLGQLSTWRCLVGLPRLF
jgi:hypothetical protein